ncbi:MAG: OB-fold nucleic acid binding domain-containing protein, partial [Chloroflexota bacterium]
DQVFAAFEPFARYGFNKAHATCYGLIAYQTAYLKANYPIEFMTAVLNGFSGRAEKVAAVIAECRRLGIEVRPPDVQKSHAPFTVETDGAGAPEAIRFGMAAIKNVGEGAIEAITSVRDGGDEPGPFRSLDDLSRRVDLRTVNKRVLESLIKANAVASLGTASALLGALDMALEAGQRHQRDVAAGQSTLFDLFAPAADDAVSFLDGGEEIPRRERLRWEKELIGLYLSEHPLGDIADVLPEYVTAYTGELAEEAEQARVTIGGIIQSSRRVVTRSGSTMLVATIEDLQGSVEVVVFPKVFEQTAPTWSDDGVVLISGRVDHRDETAQILCESVWPWDDAVRMGPSGFAAERDRMQRARGTRGGPPPAQGVWAGTAAVAVRPEPPVAVAVQSAALPVAAGSVAVAAGTAPEADEPAAPVDAVPLLSVPVGVEGTVNVAFAPGTPADRVYAALAALQIAIRGRPGPLPVVIGLDGAEWQVKLPERVAWDEHLPDALRRVAGIPLLVELRSTPATP